MRRLFLTYRGWWYKRGHRPKPGSLLYSPSLDLVYAFRDASGSMMGQEQSDG